ncbi:MAG: hypothetical protein FWD31_04275, partial [Planctomycetaceae bacterium]|nr:hypothetical protein [Planctomycetaceae bacterium]
MAQKASRSSIAGLHTDASLGRNKAPPNITRIPSGMRPLSSQGTQRIIRFRRRRHRLRLGQPTGHL